MNENHLLFRDGIFERNILFLTRTIDFFALQKIPGAADLLGASFCGGKWKLYEVLRRRLFVFRPRISWQCKCYQCFLMGMSIAVFIMCWNITTFILFSRHFTFLAATQYPFLKYCINNSIIPLVFLVFYIIKGYQYAHYKELVNNVEIIFIGGGFIAGLLFILTISFIYFFNADKTILRKLQPLFNNAANVFVSFAAGTSNSQVVDPFRMVPGVFFKSSPVQRCVALLTRTNGKDL